MAVKVFTNAQRKLLSQNPYVETIEPTRITYTEEFKIYYVKNYLAGKKPTEIFISAGFDPNILGNKRIERASARWRKLYADGQLNINSEEIIMENKPEKKRRGRPRKNPIIEEKTVAKENIVSEEKTEYTPKKRRGRPRKNPQAETMKTQEKVQPAKKTRKRTNKIAAMAQNLNTAENIKEEQAMPQTEIKPAKRRGRPRKNPIETPAVIATEPTPKKRRGRPRKNPIETTSTVTQKVNNVPMQAEKPTETMISVIPQKQEIEINEKPITALVKAINRLTRQVDSLKRLVAGKKKVNY